MDGFGPIYWLRSHSLLALAAGKLPRSTSSRNAVILALTTGLLAFRNSTPHWLQPRRRVVSGMAYVLGGPVVENAYTLSKPELLQCFFLLLRPPCLAVPPESFREAARA